MNPKERVKAAMQNHIPDRVPVIPQICHPHAINVLGMDFRETIIECLKKPDLMNKLVLACARRYGVDGFRVWIPPDPVEVVDEGEKVWQLDETSGKRIGQVDFQGGGWIVPVQEEPVLNTLEEVEAVEVVSAEELLGTDKMQSVKEIIEAGQDDFFIIGAPASLTFEYVTVVRGKQQAMLDIVDQPKWVKAMIEKATDISIEQSIALAKLGADALYLGETFGGLIGPRLFEEFCVPAFKRLVKAVRQYDILTYLHICGNSSAILELMADTGVNCIEPLDPLGGVKVADVKKRVGQRVALMGGVNTLLLAQGTLPEVIDDCKRCLEEGAPEGGYILAAGDMLPTETSKEKVEAMVETAKHYTY